MQVNVIIQKDKQNTLSNEITKAFENNPKKAYFFLSDLKDSGFKIIEDGMIDNAVKSYFAIGINKKNTTRSMLEDMLRYTDDVYYYSNNSLVEFTSNICVFEYSNKALIYISCDDISDQTITDNILVYTKLEYNLETKKDHDEYNAQIKKIKEISLTDNFKKLTSTVIEDLITSKEIFSTRQYVHNVKSIAELLGEKEKKEEEKEKVVDDIETPSIEIPKVDLSDMDFDLSDIDISEVEEYSTNVKQEDINNKNDKVKVKEKNNTKDDNKEIEVENLLDIPDLSDLAKLANFNDEEIDNNNENNNDNINDVIDENNELYDETLKDMEFDSGDILDINSMLFSKADLKLDLNNQSDKTKEKKYNDEKDKEIVKVKKVNLNNITNFIYQLPSKTSKGQDVSSLKIPNYIQTMIPEFFELVENGKNVKIEGSNYKIRDITVEIVDVENNKKYSDRKARIMHKSGQSYLTFNSDILKDIKFEESDIARVIKLSSDIYHIEIIPKDMEEYKIWNKLCNQTFKSSTRKYGMM